MLLELHDERFCRLQELVQVESLAQMGVQLLLFALGLEFSLSKLRAVRAVALLGMHSMMSRYIVE